MGMWENGVWRWRVTWRHELRDLEKAEEADFINYLHNFQPHAGEKDKWRWRGSMNGTFSVREAYKEISRSQSTAANERQRLFTSKALWKAYAPFKAKVMVWRLLKDRLPTKDNLRKRKIIEHLPPECCCCSQVPESALHLFTDCDQVHNLWLNIIQWIGVNWVRPKGIVAHLVSFSSLLGSRKCKERLIGLWICVIWVVWKWRNSVVFGGKGRDFQRIEEEIKIRFWNWCLARGEARNIRSYPVWAKAKLFEVWNVN